MNATIKAEKPKQVGPWPEPPILLIPETNYKVYYAPKSGDRHLVGETVLPSDAEALARSARARYGQDKVEVVYNPYMVPPCPVCGGTRTWVLNDIWGHSTSDYAKGMPQGEVTKHYQASRIQVRHLDFIEDDPPF